MSSHIPLQMVVEDRSTRNTDHKTSCWSCSFAKYAAERILILGIRRISSNNAVVVHVWHNLVKSKWYFGKAQTKKEDSTECKRTQPLEVGPAQNLRIMNLISCPSESEWLDYFLMLLWLWLNLCIWICIARPLRCHIVSQFVRIFSGILGGPSWFCYGVKTAATLQHCNLQWWVRVELLLLTIADA